MTKKLLLLAILPFFLAACGQNETAAPQTAAAPESAAESVAEPEATAPLATAEPPPLIPRTTIFGNPDRTMARISPDGAHVSWLAPKDGVLNVFVAPAGDPQSARVVTNDSYRGIRSYFWAPNSKYIYFVQDQGGDENFHVYSSDIASGDVRDLTPVKEGARATIEAVSADRPDHIVVGINERDAQIFDLYIVDVTTGDRELLKENPGYAAWLIDNALEPRFGLAPTPDGGANVVDFEGNVFSVIPPEDFLATQALGFNGDNSVIYLIDSRERDKAALTAVTVENGELNILASSDVADVSGILTDPATNEPVAYNVNHLKSAWFALTPQTEADFEVISRELQGSLSIVSTTHDMSRWVIHNDATDEAGAYYIYDRPSASVSQMLVTQPELTRYDLAPMQAVVIKARDGLDLVSYLTLPPGSDSDRDGRPDAPLPMVLAVHGGPWARDEYGYNSWHQWMANRGYAVLSVNYRGSTGFGKSFTRAAIREFAGKMHDDLIDGVNWAIAEEIADPEKVAITGGSYGGYATLIGVSFTPDTFACGVDIVGPSSLVTLIESFPEYWKPFLAGTWYSYVGDPANEEERADMLARSAISRIDDITVPLLVGQGENDPRVTKQESDQLVEAMATKEQQVTYVNFPDEGHGFARPENRLAFYAVMEGFLAQCLGGRTEKVGEAFEGSTIEVLHGGSYLSYLPLAEQESEAESDEAGSEEN
jgi:dipeptidyl aminopeptidase/acylaminoacyl peptidase